MRYVGEIGHKANRIAASIAGREVRPTAGVAVDLERAEMAIGAAGIERDKLGPTRLPAGSRRASTAGKAASEAMLMAAKGAL